MPTANIQKPEWLLEMESVLQMMNEGVMIADDGLRCCLSTTRCYDGVVINAKICWAARQQLSLRLAAITSQTSSRIGG
jgi:hypothetical protein